MSWFANKLEKIFTAVTFAEAGELDTARQIMNEEETAAEIKDSRTKNSRVMPHDSGLTVDSAT